MQKQTFTPPDFLGEDTSIRKLRSIPHLTLGLPSLFQFKTRPSTFVSVIRIRDLSGNYVGKR